MNTYYIEQDIMSASQSGKTIDTSDRDIGYYTDAVGMLVANGVFSRAAQAAATTVTGGATVSTMGGTTILALYAQAYLDAQGNTYLLVTNKGSGSEVVQITAGGSAPQNYSFAMTYTSGGKPVQTQPAANPVAIPPYSVVRLDLASPTATTLANVSAASGSFLLALLEIASAYGSGLRPGDGQRGHSAHRADLLCFAEPRGLHRT